MSRSKRLSGLLAKGVEQRARSARRPLTMQRRVHVELLEERQLLATITVNTVSDTDSVGATLSLRQAIEISNGTLLGLVAQSGPAGASEWCSEHTQHDRFQHSCHWKGRFTTSR